MSQTVFFAHANGFPSATYGKLLAPLQNSFEVRYLAQHAHDPRFPVSNNWEHLVAELIHHLEAQGGPVWGVGHSFGGLLHYHSALRRPDLYSGVVMLDTPVLTLADRLVIRAAKKLGFIDRITPAGRSLGRREWFEGPQQALEYFSGKGLFRRFDPQCLSDYVSHGLKPSGAQWRLAFEADTEIGIYRAIPDTEPAKARQLKVPLALVRGRHSTVVLPHHTLLVRSMAQGEVHSLPGSHMFPLERPSETAQLIEQLLSRWQGRL